MRRRSTAAAAAAAPAGAPEAAAAPAPAPPPRPPLWRRALAHARFLLTDWRGFPALAALLLLLELLLGALVVTRVRFTEIDWRAYMQEVEGWAVHGRTDYRTLRGSTGPLVYPAGFLHVFRALRWAASPAATAAATAACENSQKAAQAAAAADATLAPPEPCGGLDVRTAQWAFLALYLAAQALALDIYRLVRPGPPYIVLLLVLSKRLHSIFLLRLFNDGVTTLAFLAALALLMRRRFLVGTLAYSLAVSVKMNALLALPALGLLLLRNLGGLRAGLCLAAGLALQLLLAAPFLTTRADAEAYFAKAFEFSRVFFHQWTVNWKFLPEDVFVSKWLALLLLALHLGTLLLFAHRRWSARDGGLPAVLRACALHEVAAAPAWLKSRVEALLGDGVLGGGGGRGWAGRATSRRRASAAAPMPQAQLADARTRGAFADGPAYTAELLWACGFVGIAFARTLHFQFLAWYFHSLPLLLWRARFLPRRLPSWLHDLVRLAIWLAIERGFSAVDGTPGPDGRPKGEPLASSALTLQAAHLALLLGLMASAPPFPRR